MNRNGREAREDRACEIGCPYPKSATKFLVMSSSGNHFYLVDMDENKKVGSCTCEDFQIRNELNESDFATDPCKHILRVMIWYNEEGLEAVREIEARETRRRQHYEVKYPIRADETFFD